MRALLFAVLFSGCQATPTEVRERVRLTTAATVAPGDELELTLENGLARPVLYNLCFVAFTPPLNDVVCTAQADRLDPGASTTARRAIPSTADAGTYVAHTSVEVDDVTVELTADAFTVTAP